MTSLAPTTSATREPESALPPANVRRRPLALQDVDVVDSFWSAKQNLTRETTIPAQERIMRSKGYFQALTLTWRKGDWYTPHVFWESDLAKWIEAGSYTLATHPTAEMTDAISAAIDLLDTAQQPDGYLNPYFTVVAPEKRFTDHEDAHELYCAGHLIEAGVAHFEATGTTRLLDIVCRYADLIDERFGPGGADEGGYDGHPEIELALVRLSKATGNRRYLDLSKRLLDNRGTAPYFFERQRDERSDDGMFANVFPGRRNSPERYRTYQQSHLPVREQRDAVGHAVRAMYLYTAMTDVGVETGDETLWAAGVALWRSVTEKKMYITGSVGTEPRIEGFGPDYDLPNATGYGETCAAIGLANWAARLGNASGDAQYFDVLERALYNGVISGASADGTHYFYGNPLSSDGSKHRNEWFDTSCCPPNLARFLSGLGRLVYARNDDTLAVNLFLASEARAEFDSTVFVKQETDYPRSGGTRITVSTEQPAPFVLAVRIPSWCDSVTIDGEPLTDRPGDGFVRFDRTWQGETVIEIDAELPVRRMRAHPAVAQDRGLVALQRGPIVFCAEATDNEGETSRLILPRASEITVVDDPDSGLVRLTAPALIDTAPWDNSLYTDGTTGHRPTELAAVPYFYWDNREPGSMDVWLREED